jgi:hypothetical protein
LLDVTIEFHLWLKSEKECLDKVGCASPSPRLGTSDGSDGRWGETTGSIDGGLRQALGMGALIRISGGS